MIPLFASVTSARSTGILSLSHTHDDPALFSDAVKFYTTRSIDQVKSFLKILSIFGCTLFDDTCTNNRKLLPETYQELKL